MTVSRGLVRPGTEGFLHEALEGWISPVAKSMASAGVDQNQARVLARLSLAVTRGLLLDLLASGDSADTTDAFGRSRGCSNSQQRTAPESTPSEWGWRLHSPPPIGHG
jgi:hypothetical protein